MTQRERHTSGGAFDAAAPRAVAPPPGPAPTPPWDDLFHTASPAQQHELLALARRQGVLYAHQLPPATNGSADRGRHLLGRLLDGHTGDLEPLRAAPVPVTDAELDECQRDAVAKALQTPDVCLIQGLPGTGKSRVVAEIVTQAAARGERVLLVAPTPPPVDRVLGAVADRPALCPIRCVGRDETAEDVPAASRGFTLLERLRHLRDHTLPRAREEVTLAEERCRRLRRHESAWPRLRQLAEEHGQLAARRADLEAARARVDGDVEREAGDVESAAAAASPFADGLRAAVRARDEALARVAGDLAKLQARLAEAAQEQEALDARLQALAPLAEARRHSRWWSASWWQSLFRGNVLAQAEEAEASRQRVRDELQALEQQKQQLLAEQAREKVCYAAERSRQAEAERRRRHAERDAAEAAWGHEDQQARAKWQAACAELEPEVAAPAAPTPGAVDSAGDVWQRALQQGEEQAAFARQWATCLEETADTFPQRLLGLCNLVAATTGSLPADPHFGEAAASPVRFDLLVLEDADRVTEAEFLAVARRARRWVLVGQPPAVPVPDPVPQRPGPAKPALRPALFHRLWQQLHCDPRRLPYAWVREKGGLCCQLRPVTPEQSQWLESEPLADSPDIELRILAMPRREPLLAEVVFPAGVPIDRAKEYIFRELQELPVAAAGRSLRWLEDDDRIVLRLADAPAPDGVAVCLEPGVRETLRPGPEDAAGRPPAGSAWQTCCVEFDRRAGWHRQRAEEWVQRHLGLRDLGRTARLDVAYRMQPGLAALLSELLFGGEYRLPGGADAAGLSGLPVVEFVPVPALHENSKQPAGAVYTGRAGGRGRSAQGLSTAAPPRKGGAGLELDLSDPRHRDRLPTEHRAALPDAGLVNYFEALAVRQALEALAAEATARAARPAVGVIALYPAQAELIRRLVQQLPALAAALDVRVGVPGSFQEGECSVVLLGLTRSHGHRAVSFGDGPHALALALTRARSRVLVFGDLGTLQRRCQWQNPLDHLDEAASAREHDVISRLVAYVQGQGRHPHLFQVREGSPA